MWIKVAVVTTKPRRSRKGRGAAAIIKKNTNNIDAVVTPRWSCCLCRARIICDVG